MKISTDNKALIWAYQERWKYILEFAKLTMCSI